MSDRPRGMLRAPLALALGIGITLLASVRADHLAGGPAAGNAPLEARATVVWSIQSADGQPLSRMNGESVVGPDGRIEVGPYGGVHVAGLTVVQAQTVVENHLAHVLKQPRVWLQRVEVGPVILEPVPIVSVGRVVPLNDSAGAGAPVIIATSAQEVAPVAADPAPTPATEAAPPAAPAAPETAPMPTVVKPVVPAGPAGPTTAGEWRPLVREGVPASPPIQATGLRRMPRGAVVTEPGAAVVVQPEPNPADLKIQPRQMPVEPGPAPLAEGPAALGVPVMPHGAGVPHEQARILLPPYVIDPPDVLMVQATNALPTQPIRGQHLVRPDGTIGLGIYGSVRVAGLTLDEAKDAIAELLATRIEVYKKNPEVAKRELAVDVLAYNSKYYYVITDGGGYGEQVTRFPITGSETVLDAVSQIGGLHAVASKKNIWVARTSGGHPGMQTLPVDWCGITQRGDVSTNYQVMPNDRIYVKAKGIVTFDTALARLFSPVERLFGVVLLGSTTVNSIKNGGLGTNNGR